MIRKNFKISVAIQNKKGYTVLNCPRLAQLVERPADLLEGLGFESLSVDQISSRRL